MKAVTMLREELKQAKAREREAHAEVEKIERALDVMTSDGPKRVTHRRRKMSDAIPAALEALSINGGLRAGALAVAIDRPSSSTTLLIRELESRGWIAERNHSHDPVELSPAGKDQVDAARDREVKLHAGEGAEAGRKRG